MAASALQAAWRRRGRREGEQKGYNRCLLREVPPNSYRRVCLYYISQNLETWQHFVAKQSGICSLYSEWPYAMLKFITMVKGKMSYWGENCSLCFRDLSTSGGQKDNFTYFQSYLTDCPHHKQINCLFHLSVLFLFIVLEEMNEGVA